MPHLIVSSGQVTVSSDASALGSMAVAAVLVAGHLSNTTALYVGGSTTQALFLPSGQVLGPLGVSNLNQLYAKTSAGSATVTWLALTGGREG